MSVPDDMDFCWEWFEDLIDRYDGKSWNEGRNKELKEFSDHLKDQGVEPEDIEEQRRMLDAMMRGGSTIEDESLRRQVRLARISKDAGCDLDDGFWDYAGRYMLVSGDGGNCYGNSGDDIQDLIDTDLENRYLEEDDPVQMLIYDLDRPNGWWNAAFECEVEKKITTTWKGRRPDGLRE